MIGKARMLFAQGGASKAAAETGAEGESRRRRRGLGPRELRAIGATVTVAVLLTVLTIVTFTQLPRYDFPGEPLLENWDFSEGFRGWQTRGIISLDERELGRAILQNRNRDNAVFLRRTIELPPGRTSLLLSADVATDGVIRGKEPWQGARIYLVQMAPNDEMLWNQENRLVHLVGTVSRQHVAKVFEVPAGIHRVMLGIELPYATGRFEIANLRLAVLEELVVFRLVATLLVAGWCLLLAFAGWHVVRSIRSPRIRTLLVVAFGLLAIGVFMPSTLRQVLINNLADGFGIHTAYPDALGHAAVFALLALLVRAGRPHDPLLLHASCWVLAGAVTEVLQLLTFDRAPEAADWLADVAGTAIGLALAELGLHLERLLTPAKKKPGVDRAG